MVKKTSRNLQTDLEQTLQKILAAQNDTFLPGQEYISRWNYPTTSDHSVPCTP